MKKLFLALLCASHAIAGCPDLRGHFICKDNRAKDLVISQIDTETGTVYQISNAESVTEVLANGKDQPLVLNNFQGTVSYTCEDNHMRIVEKGELYEDGILVGYMRAETTLIKNISGNLISKGEAYITHWNENYRIDLGYECVASEQSILHN